MSTPPISSTPPRSSTSISSLNLRIGSRTSSPHYEHTGSPLSMHPARTPSLATVAREIAQERQTFRLLDVPSPSNSGTRFQFEMEDGKIKEEDLLISGTISSDKLTDHLFDSGDSYQNPTYNVYSTYDTYDSDRNDRDSSSLLCPSFPAGIIRFLLPDGEDTKDRYYMTVQKDVSLDDVARFMAIAWRRRTPKLVLSIISSSHYFVPWEQGRFADDFRDGIIQAANSTEMWILTEGFDLGVSKLIGDAALREMTRRKNIAQNPLHIQNIPTEERLPRLNIFGIASKSSLIYSDVLSGTQIEAQNVINNGGKPKLGLFDLNPDHTHFILMDDGTSPDLEGLSSFRLGLETRFTKPVGKPRRYHQAANSLPSVYMPNASEAPVDMEEVLTPVVGLLVQGGPPDIEHIHHLLQKKIPVVVIEGSGLAADLVCFAYNEMEQRSDPEYLDSYIKAELMRRVSDAFPDDFVNDDIARNLCRDRIIECVKLNYQDNLSFLTIINSDHGARLNDISKYLLTALFKSQARLLGRHWREQLQWDLQLTLDWNRPDLARSEIFNRYNLGNFKVSEHTVHSALIRPNREEFIELFLEHGLLIHTYLNHKRLHNLFENPADKDCFVTMCLEGVLGKSVTKNMPICRNFVDDANCELNHLLYRCTGLQRMVNPYELSMNSLGTYITDRDVAERRATNTLVLWAALTNRYKLAKLLWKRTEDPMAVALIVSMILHRLATDWCKKDLDMRQHVKETAAEFGKMAVSMLRLSFKESSVYTFSSLSKKLEDFNNRTVVELAKLGRNKYFIAHSCCQKWLTQRWFGNIHIRELDSSWSLFKLPDGLKIYLSVLLVFPMFLWISYQNVDEKITIDEDDDDYIDENQEMSMLLRVTSMEEKMRKSRKRSRVRVTFQNILDRGESTPLPFRTQIYYLWSAPVTKFWMNQLMYFIYIMVMSVSLLMPDCGVFALNIIVLFWTITVCIEMIRLTYNKKKLYPEVSLVGHVFETIMVIIFIFLLLALRILPRYVQYVSFMTSKFLMSAYLLFFYFRFMAMSVPVSPTLGPMLVSIVIMTKKDFSDWMRLFFMVLVSGAITIQAVIYPSFPFGVESLRQAFSRAIFGLFLTKVDDLDGFSCSPLFEDDEFKYCDGTKYNNVTYQKSVAKCPHASLLNYVIVIPYLLNAKLIFITLLYAMFAVTTGKVYNESVEIWKYQRYGMIVDFEERLILPPPFTLLCYVFFMLKWLGHFIYRLVAKICVNTNCCGPRMDHKEYPTKIQIVKFRRTWDYNYWKECINHYTEEEQAAQLESQRAKMQSDCLAQLLDQMTQQRLLTRQLNDRIVQLESNFTNSCVLLEEMKHMIKRLDPATQVLHQEPKKLIHIYARQSPYKHTFIRRFPVFDKFVPWEVPCDTYDPGVYTRPVEQFKEDIRIFVDPDVLEIIQEQSRRNGLSAEELEDLPPLPEFHPMYNAVMASVIDDVQLEIDRTSWISVDNQPLRYKLDTLGIPINPIGRTGLRGRGGLWRFGPNHRIAAVVTRWRRRYSPLGFPLDHMLVDGKRVLESIIVTRADTGELTLPGGNVYGKTTAYSVMCEEFLTSVFLEEEVEGSLKLDQEDMISYFAQFARTSGTQFQDPRVDMAASGFSAAILYRGYIDDPANTDNAWREAEVWNFHYDLQDMFDDKIKERENMWREVMPHMRLYGNQDTIVLEAARIHNAYH